MSGEPKIERPGCVEERHLLFLDQLRESGATNMFGAAAVLLEMFPSLGHENARVVLGYWMRSFAERHPRTDGMSR